MSKTTISDFLAQATRRLGASGIATARLDCLVLLEDVLGRDRSWILAHQDECLSVVALKDLNKKVARRAKHEPLAYIRQQTEFYGRIFYIDHRVLEPRPESETMIDLLKALPDIQSVADIGTGSGALAITAKLELPHALVTAIDIDPACLQVAARNAEHSQAKIHLLPGDLLAPVAEMTAIDALLCNLPYVPDSFQINPAAMREPRLAIFGGPDGLDLYRKLFTQCEALPAKPRFVLTEALPMQHAALTAIAGEHRFKLTRIEDFIQLFQPTD